MTAEAAEMTRAITVAAEVRAAIPDPHWNKLCAAFEFAPYQRCTECGKTIDLRVEAANLIVCTLTDTDGRASYLLAHLLCAPSQATALTSVERDRADERWFGQPVGHGFSFFEAVPMSDGGERLVLLVELQTTDVVFSESAGGELTARSGVLEALTGEDGFAYLAVETGLTDLPRVPDWKILLTPEGDLSAILGVPGRNSVSSGGVFLASGGAGEPDPVLAGRLTDGSNVILLVVPPATFGLPEIPEYSEDPADLTPAVLTSLIMNAAGLAAREDPAVPLTDRKVFHRALADRRIVGGQVEISRPDLPGIS
ncbi:hypothetical protein [Streptomyces sp. NRRL S-350]|uniref:hypothetical protein n=1 Tax=Streptomyces sp. NRRL S-350 TaxID=1463902 RepID=UPI000AAB726D|nr:hypothetical protein [Streptomyces sp. NRRL S-350]